MSHQVYSMAYKKETPWHGLGANLNGMETTLEDWKQAAGLNFIIQETPVRFTADDGTSGIMPDRKVLYRSDTHDPLAVVSNRYQVVQPDTVIEFYRSLVERDGMELETAGVLKGGKVLWAMATNNDQSVNIGGDIIKPYLVLTTACDGTSATKAYRTSVRPVCNNTLQWSFGDTQDMVSVSHSTTFNADTVKQRMGFDAESIDRFSGMVDNLSRKGISDKTAVNYFAELYVRRDGENNVTNEKQLERVVNDIMHAYKHGPGSDLSTARGTAWGALNAVTHYIDHETRAHNEENRFLSGQFGQGARIKQRAVELLDGIPVEVEVEHKVTEPTADNSTDDFERLLSM